MVVERADIKQHRADVISLFERNGMQESVQRFDWYYREQGQERPLSWILWDSKGEVSGLCSVTIRPLRHGNEIVRAGVAGNLLVDRKRGIYLGAVALVRAMKSLVSAGEIDILLGIPNQLSQPIFNRLDFRVIDRWTTHAFVRRSGTLLQSHFGWSGRLASPIIDLCAAAARLGSNRSDGDCGCLRVQRIDENGLGGLPLEEWIAPQQRFAVCPSREYLRWRFLRDPLNQHEMLAITSLSGEVCGYVIVRRDAGRSWIVDCAVDRKQTTEESAISEVCHTQDATLETIWVAHLRSAPLSRKLTTLGFLGMTPFMGGYPDLPLMGYWLSQHPLARPFSEGNAWDLFTGFNDV